MNWNYKGYNITIREDGMFYVNIFGYETTYFSLRDTKNSIDTYLLIHHKSEK